MGVIAPSSGKDLRYAVMWPLVPAMAMVMIDFTIVSISVTSIQQDLHLSATVAQWTVTAYALATAAFVVLGGRLGDIFGHKRIVTTGVLIFAAASILCGLTPDGSSLSEPWLIVFRSIQGIGGALLIPSATVIVLDAFPPDERGKGLSLFFIAAGLFTALGPIAGSYLTEYWTWRAIFWINAPVALFALIELRRSRIRDTPHPAPIDWRGSALLVAGMALTVLGVQQSTVWGWGSVATLASIVVGVVLLVTFWRVERGTEHPLIDVRALVANRAFAVDNAVMFLFFIVWLAIFLFGSMYFQISAGQPPSQAGFSILTVFFTFFAGSRVGGVMFDSSGPKRPVTLGLLVTAVGLGLWAYEAPQLEHINVLAGQLVTGAGMGLVMSAINTDALNRVTAAARGEASGIVQMVRNFGSALGVAVLGTVLLTVQQNKTAANLEAVHVPASKAHDIASSLLQQGAGGQPGGGGGIVAQTIGKTLPADFADAFQVAFYVGAGIMFVTFLFALSYMPSGRQTAID